MGMIAKVDRLKVVEETQEEISLSIVRYNTIAEMPLL